MKYEVVPDQHYPNSETRVEAIDEDGSIFVAVFAGPDHAQRAADYAEWRESEEDEEVAEKYCAHCGFRHSHHSSENKCFIDPTLPLMERQFRGSTFEPAEGQ